MMRAALFDGDGVTILAPSEFARVYRREHGLDDSRFEKFFGEDFASALAGKADLEELIAANKDVWAWDKDPNLLIDMWFKAEDHPNKQLVREIKRWREQGMAVYLATNQERHRARYLREAMFPRVFDGMFISCELGFMKPEDEYFKAIIKQLLADLPGISAAQIAFFDDNPKNVAAAVRAGLSAHLYESVEQVRNILRG
jgi:putative hydrolase of the HAD superfamily